MEPIVDLAPGADSPLAQFFAERVRENVRTKRGRTAFFSLKATIFVVDFDSGQAITLRFDHGRLILHEGTIGVPSVTFGGPVRALFSLDRLRLRELPRAVFGRDAEVSLVDDQAAPASTRRVFAQRVASERLGLREMAEMYARGELRIYGLLAHPRTVSKFLRLVALPRPD